MGATKDILKAKISENWKQKFLKYTGVIDVSKVSDEKKVGHWTLNSIRTGARNVATDENKKAVEGLAIIAIQNAEMKMKEIQDDIESMKEDFKSIFDCI